MSTDGLTAQGSALMNLRPMSEIHHQATPMATQTMEVLEDKETQEAKNRHAGVAHKIQDIIEHDHALNPDIIVVRMSIRTWAVMDSSSLNSPSGKTEVSQSLETTRFCSLENEEDDIEVKQKRRRGIATMTIQQKILRTKLQFGMPDTRQVGLQLEISRSQGIM